MPRPALSLVLPAYNEADNIDRAVREAAAAGARAFVAGNAVFSGGPSKYSQAIETIRREAAIGAGAMA